MKLICYQLHTLCAILFFPRVSSTVQVIKKERLNACVKECEIKSVETFNRHLCNPSLNLQPSPLVYKSCVSGIKRGFATACNASCAGKKKESDSFVICSDEAKKSRLRDISWCRKGFEEATRAVESAFLVDFDELSKNDILKDQEINKHDVSDYINAKVNKPSDNGEEVRDFKANPSIVEHLSEDARDFNEDIHQDELYEDRSMMSEM